MRLGLLSELVTIGYDIFPEGENIKLHYRKQDDPPDAAKPLIAELKTCKAEVLKLLKQATENPFPLGSPDTGTELPQPVNPADIMDEILKQTQSDIQCCGKWKTTLEVREIEDEIDRLYKDAVAGERTIEEFRVACLRWKRAGILEPATDHDNGKWDEPMAELIRWFLNYDLPEQPFSISPYEQVLHPARYYEALKRDIEAGPKCPRARYGALQSDLQRLKVYCEGMKPDA